MEAVRTATSQFTTRSLATFWPLFSNSCLETTFHSQL